MTFYMRAFWGFIFLIAAILGLSPKARAQDISAYFFQTDIAHTAFSPSGDKLAIYRQDPYNGILTDGWVSIIESASGKTLYDFPLNNKDIQWIYFSDEDSLAVFSRAFFGTVSNGFRTKRRVSDVVEIYDLEGNFQHTIFDETPFFDDPDMPTISVIARNSENRSLITLYQNKSSPARLVEFGQNIDPPRVIETGSEATLTWLLDEALTPYLRMDRGEEPFITRYFRPEVEGGKNWEHIYTGYALVENFQVVAQPRRSSDILVIQKEDDAQRAGLYRLPIGKTTQAERVFEHPRYDLAGARAFGPDNRLYYAWWWEDKIERKWFDPELERMAGPLVQKLGQAHNWQIENTSRDETIWLVSHQGPQSAPAISLYNTQTQILSPLVQSARPIPQNRIPNMRRVTFIGEDGEPLTGLLTEALVPPFESQNQDKVLVIPPYGPGRFDAPDWDPLGLYFAGQGYTVFRPQLRGSGGKGRAHIELANHEIGGKVSSDFRRAIEALETEGILRPETQLFLLGHGLGGYAVLDEMTRFPDKMSCGASINAPSDLLLTLENFNREGSRQNYLYYKWRSWLGDAKSDRDKLIARSPVQRAGQVKAPLLLIHAYDDEVISVAQSERFHARAREAGAPTRLVRFSQMGHGDFTDDRLFDIMSAVDTFFQICSTR